MQGVHNQMERQRHLADEKAQRRSREEDAAHQSQLDEMRTTQREEMAMRRQQAKREASMRQQEKEGQESEWAAAEEWRASEQRYEEEQQRYRDEEKERHRQLAVKLLNAKIERDVRAAAVSS